MRFKWDNKKSELVKKGRGVSFEQAQIAVKDALGSDLLNDDPEQYIAVGFSSNGVLISVIHEFREDEDGIFVWIVTLWKTTKQEKKRYQI